MISSAILLRPRSGRARDCSRNRARPFAPQVRLTAAEVCRPQRNLRRVPARFFKSSASTIAVSLAMDKRYPKVRFGAMHCKPSPRAKVEGSRGRYLSACASGSFDFAQDDEKFLPPWRRFCRFRRFQPEDGFAFFHQVETIACDYLQISWIRLQPANFARRSCQQQLLLIALRLERVDLSPRRLHFLIRRNEQADDPEPNREK